MPPKAKTEKPAKTAEDVSPETQLESFLKANKDDHFNFAEDIFYKVSTGSLILDIETDGGLTPGFHRFCGPTESGKTSALLEVIRNFLLMPNSRAVLIKAEGRLGPEIRARSGVTFVFNSAEWKDGTCFVLESNIHEVAISLIDNLIENNHQKKRYLFAVDSVDALQLKGDRDKSYYECGKVAGGSLLNSVFLKRMNLAIAKLGHMGILLSQVRSEVQLDPYAKKDFRPVGSSGGHAVLHYPNWIFEFAPKTMSSLIKKDPDAQVDRIKNPILGHHAKIVIKKSPNEKTHYAVEYPIRHGQIGGKSIWREREVLFLLISSGIAKKATKMTFSISPEFLAELKANEIEMEPEYVGENKLFKALEKDPKLVEYCYDYFKSKLSGVKLFA